MSDKRNTTFTAMRDATREDYRLIGRHSVEFFAGLPERVLTHLKLLAGDTGGYAVDRLTHSLQTATRARRSGSTARGTTRPGRTGSPRSRSGRATWTCSRPERTSSAWRSAAG